MENFHNLTCWCENCFWEKLKHPEKEDGFRELQDAFEEEGGETKTEWDT